jgi:outer membrane protein OmpA-like peptidoglycan-associated protein
MAGSSIMRCAKVSGMAAVRSNRLRCAIVAIASCVPAVAGAQDRGWWGSRPPIPREQPMRMPTDASERDAAVIYAEARADLDAARFAGAQRRLELLVARYPHSALADVARRDLQKIYALTTPQPSAAPAPAHSTEAVRPLPSIEVARPADGMRPAALPNGADQRSPAAARLGGTRAPAAPVTSALRLAAEDFRQQAGDRVFFSDGSSDLGARARVALEAQAAWLIRHPDVKVLVEGHADDQGSQDFNRQMAERRAEVVRLRLEDLGVPAERIHVEAHGRNDPLADCPEQACKSQNRRVVTAIVHVPTKLGFDEPARRSLGSAASIVGQPSRAP